MANPVSLSGYKMTFDAEMTSSADMAKFRTVFENDQRALYNNGEAQAYADFDANNPGPFSFSDGALNITASPTPYYGQPYTSGMISTLNSFTQAYGYFEIRADTPGDKGFWPAFWMLPPGTGLPEIDVMEQPNNAGANSYWNYVSGITTKSGGFVDVGTDLSTGYHSYGVMWTPSTIQFSFDGKLIGDPIATPPALINQQMYMIANLAVGNSQSWPGAPAGGASAAMSIDYMRAYSNDPNATGITPQPLSTPTATTSVDQTIGNGPDAYAFEISEDAYLGDAQFTISVDGKQQGGVLTANALHAAGQSQTFTVKGDFGSVGEHRATISFLNDAWGGSDAMDRNLFVDAASFNGTALSPSGGALYSQGDLTFLRASINPDKLSVGLTEDAYQGDAQAEISLDGKVLGNVTIVAPNAGSPQVADFFGNFGAGAHSVGVKFINDAWGGDGDRNLYVKGVTLNGVSHPDATASLYWNTQVNFTL